MISVKFRTFLFSAVEYSKNFIGRRLGAKSVGVRAIVLNLQNEVLLVKHTYRAGWHTPGGGVNVCESPLTAIKRELIEEVGLEVVGNPEIFSVYLNQWRGLSDYPILYIVRQFKGTAICADRGEIEEIGWFSFNNLPADVTPKTHLRLKEFFLNQTPAEFW
ncbi:NUDIX domain-containing protein [Aeromonas enteropelogenes]|uniref:NUDIX domain-containing protein n=1 Tax=Aeromonas enteropelogenes TaxID=29489 RepID=UPI00398A0D1B